MFINHSTTETPTPSEAWSTADQNKRLDLVRDALGSFSDYSNIEVIDCKSNGEVFLEMKVPMPSNQRGTLLLNAEQVLKNLVDEAITVWLEPLGDKSTLRNLRGIKVKISRDDRTKNVIDGKSRD